MLRTLSIVRSGAVNSAKVFFTLPESVEQVDHVEAKLGFKVGEVLVAVTPIGGKARVVDAEGEGKKRTPRTIRVEGRRVGMIVEIINPIYQEAAELDCGIGNRSNR